MKLLKFQKQQLAKMIEDQNLSIDDFYWKNESHKKYPDDIRYDSEDCDIIINQQNSDYKFFFHSEFYKFSPYIVEDKFEYEYVFHDIIKWENTKKYFSIWLFSLKYELEFEDPWKILNQNPISIKSNYKDLKSYCSIEETKNFKEALDNTKKFINEKQLLTEKNLEWTNNQIEYLKDKLEKTEKGLLINSIVGFLALLFTHIGSLSGDEIYIILEFFKLTSIKILPKKTIIL